MITTSPKILDYCVLWGGAPSHWGSWIPWLFNRVSPNTVATEPSRYNNHSTYKTAPFGDGGRVGSARQQDNLYYDYWLKLDLNLVDIDKYRRIENLQLQYNGNAKGCENWCAFIFQEQTDAICAPINYPLEWTGKSFNWQCAPSIYDKPQNASQLISDNKMLAYSNIDVNNKTFTFSFDLTGKNVLYINIKQQNDNASHNYASVGTIKDLWTINSEEFTFIPKNSTITYQIDVDGNSQSSYTKDYGKDYSIGNPTSFSKTGYRLIGWQGSDGKYYKFEDTYTQDVDLILTADWAVKEYPLSIVINRCTYNEQGDILETRQLYSHEISKYVTITITDNKNTINFEEQIALKIECNDYCTLMPSDAINSTMQAITTTKTAKILETNLICNTDTNDQLQVFTINIYPNAYPVTKPDGERAVYFYEDMGFLAFTQHFTTSRINKKPGVDDVYSEIIGMETFKYNEQDLFNNTWHTILPSTTIKKNGTFIYTPLGPTTYEYSLINEDDAGDIDYWRYHLSPITYSKEEKIIINAAESSTPAVEVYYNLPDIYFVVNGEEILAVSASPSALWFEIPQRDGQGVEYWSLTKENGMPHYRTGDYIPLRNTLKLYLTTISKTDINFELLKE